MRINDTENQMEMEARDINYILPHYIKTYLYGNKNIVPKVIIFPMFPSVTVRLDISTTTEVPIEYVPPLDPRAIEIAQDGSSVPEVTPAQEAALDEKDEEINRLKEEIEELKTPLIESVQKMVDVAQEATEETTSEPESPAKAAFAKPEPEKPVTFTIETSSNSQPPPDRKPNQPPGGDIGPGLGLSDMHGRDRRDQTRTAKDLAEEPDIEESKEKEFEKTVSRDEQGRPVVEGGEQ